MKSILFAAMVAAILFVGCGGKNAQDATVTDAQAVDSTQQAAAAGIPVDKAATVIKWVGRKGVAGAKLGQHDGTISLADGSLMMKDNKVVGGKFTFDMKSITVNDLQGEMKGKLEGHLKASDFFKVDSFPTAQFEITKVEETGAEAKVEGNLTILGVSKNISFPATIKYNEGGKAVVATAKFDIDRTQWNIVYGNDQSLKDKFIHPKIELELNLVSAQ